jgi:hypothetical protein
VTKHATFPGGAPLGYLMVLAAARKPEADSVDEDYYFGRPMESEAMGRLLGEELTAARAAAAAD